MGPSLLPYLSFLLSSSFSALVNIVLRFAKTNTFVFTDQSALVISSTGIHAPVTKPIGKMTKRLLSRETLASILPPALIFALLERNIRESRSTSA